MKAITIARLDGPEGIEMSDAPPPDRLPDLFGAGRRGGDGDPGEPIIISVRAAGVSFPEVLQARGKYQFQPEPPFVPGSEVAGVVESAPATSGFAPGDRVAAYTFIGGLAESVAAPRHLTFALHDRLSFAQGAALVVNYHTAYFSLVTRGRFAEGQRVLVQGAAGGVGTATVQVAKGLGAEVVAVVSDEAKAEVALAAGADLVVRSSGPWKDEVLASMPEGVDLVIDPVGGDRLLDNLRALREGGRLVVVGFAGGEIPQIPSNRLLLKNIDAVGAGWGAYAVPKPEYLRETAERLDELIEAGALRPVVGRTFAFERAAEAFELIEARGAAGKVVVEIGG